MATRPAAPRDKAEGVFELHAGDHMTQEEFHRRYESMPDEYRAELIGGTVFEPSPLGWGHGESHGLLSAALFAYAGRTAGLQAANNATVILSDEDEVEPDVILRVSPQYSGQTRNTRPRAAKPRQPGVFYIKGAPELLAEVAHTSGAIDLRLKKERYQLAGVLEYVVLCLRPPRLYWFDLRNGAELECGSDGIFRSIVFPGLWLDSKAILERNYGRMMNTTEAGMQTAEYKDFAKRLARAKK